MPKPSKYQTGVLLALISAGIALGTIVYGPVSKALCPHKITLEENTSWCLSDEDYITETENQLQKIQNGFGADEAETLFFARHDTEFRKRLDQILKEKLETDGAISPDNYGIHMGEVLDLLSGMALVGDVPSWILDDSIPEDEKIDRISQELVNQ